MRFSLPVFPLLASVLSVFLAACASAPGAPSKNVPQSGTLKVHPGLLGQPVPPELQQPQEPRDGAPADAGKDEAGKAGSGRLKLDDAGLRTQRSVYFDLDSAELKAEFTAMLQAHARYLAQHPDARVRLEGNADERGTAEHNQKLGMKRAEAVKNSLLGQGIVAKQVKITSFGELRPKKKGHDEESWAENRRTDIVYEKEE